MAFGLRKNTASNRKGKVNGHTGRDAILGGIAGDIAGKKGHKGHTKRDALVGGAFGGAVGHHEKQKKEKRLGRNQPVNSTATTGGSTRNTKTPTIARGKRHEKLGKLEYNVGRALRSSKLERKGIAKMDRGQMEIAAARTQAEATQLETQAVGKRNQAEMMNPNL